MRRRLAIVLAAAFAVSTCVAGCGEKEADETPVAEKIVAASEEESVEQEDAHFDNASDLLKAYYEKENDNYKLIYESSMNMKASVADDSTEVPILIKMDMDCAGEHLHGTISMDMEFMGAADTEDIEMYAELDGDTVTVYEYDASSDSWNKSENENANQVLAGMQEQLIKEDRLKDAEFSYNEKEEQYELTIGFEDIADYGMLGSFLSEDMMSLLSNGQEGFYEDMMETISNLKTHYVFDQDINPISVVIDDMNFKTEISEGDVKGEIALSVGMKVTFSDFGKIKEEDVTVPAEIKESAKDLLGSDDSYEEEDEEDDDKDEISQSSKKTELSEEELAACGEPDFSLADFYGAINGVSIKIGEKNSFDKTFGAAGFKLSEANTGEYGLAMMDYEEMSSVLAASVSTKDVYASYEDINQEIKKNGFYGYDITVMNGDEVPNMTFGGLTWGASKLDVLGVYGEPNYYYGDDNYETLDYIFNDVFSIRFSLYKGGVTSVAANKYSL